MELKVFVAVLWTLFIVYLISCLAILFGVFCTCFYYRKMKFAVPEVLKTIVGINQDGNKSDV